MSTRKRHSKTVALAVVILLVVGYAVYAFTRPIPAPVPRLVVLPGKAAQTVSLPFPGYGESAVGAVGYGVLGSAGNQAPVPTASTIKILTALSVLKQHPLNVGEQGPTLTLTQDDVDSYNKYVAEDGSVVHVQVGEQISEYQALQAMLLPSANNMAETLARWAYGSLDAYSTAATQLAAQLGMTNTTVTDPSGFSPSTISTAHDLTVLGEAAIQNPVLAEIVAESSATIPVQGTVHNVNQLLGQDGIIGLKTGNSDQDPGAFIFAATHDVSGHPVTVIGTILNAQDLGTAMHDSVALISSTGQNFTLATPVARGTVVGSYSAKWTKPVTIVAQKDLTVLNWQGSTLTSLVSLKKEVAPLAANTVVGTVTVQNSLDNSKTSVPVLLKQAIPKPSWVWRLEHAF